MTNTDRSAELREYVRWVDDLKADYAHLQARYDCFHEFVKWVAEHRLVDGIYADDEHPYKEWVTPEGEYDADLDAVVERARELMQAPREDS
jgi:hypothetical protein